LPDTIQQVTGSGGTHYLFQLPDFPVQNSKSKLAQGLDIAWPPRLHHGRAEHSSGHGRAYFWDGAEEIEEQKIAAAPGLADRLAAARMASSPAALRRFRRSSRKASGTTRW
jgi:hypothetical protein